MSKVPTKLGMQRNSLSTAIKPLSMLWLVWYFGPFGRCRNTRLTSDPNPFLLSPLNPLARQKIAQSACSACHTFHLSPASMCFLSSYLNLLRKDMYKSYQANEGEIYASWGVETLSFGRTASWSAKRSGVIDVLTYSTFQVHFVPRSRNLRALKILENLRSDPSKRAITSWT